MTIHLPEDLENSLRLEVSRGRFASIDEALAEAARLLLKHRRPTIEGLLDGGAIRYCEAEADDSITLDEVRAATSRIEGSMARVVIEEERAERS